MSGDGQNVEPDATVIGQPTGESVHAALLKLRNGADVWGTDGELGPIVAIVVDPSTNTATEIAVRNRDVAGTGRMVPVGQIIASTTDRVDVGLTRQAFFTLPRFLVPYRAEPVTDNDPPPDVPAWSDVWLMRPGTYLLGVHENVPSDEVPIRRGLGVFGPDGTHVGNVESWNFEPDTAQLASVEFKTRHLHHRRHLLVDASTIESVDATGLRLGANLTDLDAAPASDQ